MKGVVVCPQPRAADVGAAILAKGGNAFDAAVATAFSQMVNDPFMCGIGGMGTLHYYRADEGRSGMVDFYNRAGSKVRPDMWQHDLKGRTEISGYSLFDDYRSEIGYTSIMTPGSPAGFGLFHERHCSLPWAELLAPAIAQAEEGIVVTPHLAGVWTRYRQPGIPDGYTRLTKTAECARVYLHPEDRFYEVGEVMRLPDYARTLERIARGGWRGVPPRRARRRDRRGSRRERRVCHARRHRRLRAGVRCAARRLVSRLRRALQSAAGQRCDADRDAADPRALRTGQARPQLGAAPRPGRARDGGGARRSQRVSRRSALRRRADRNADLQGARRVLGGEDRAWRVSRRRETGAALVHHASLHHGQRWQRGDAHAHARHRLRRRDARTRVSTTTTR